MFCDVLWSLEVAVYSIVSTLMKRKAVAEVPWFEEPDRAGWHPGNPEEPRTRRNQMVPLISDSQNNNKRSQVFF